MGKLFYGTYNRSLDAKGRLLIPSKLPIEGDEIYLVRGHEGCLAIYDQAGFEELGRKYSSADFEDGPETRAKLRFFYASVIQTERDPVGRVLIGKALCRDYGLGKEVLLIGAFDHLEVWDPVAYATYSLANGHAFDAPKRGAA